jgi:hypothetical protein
MERIVKLQKNVAKIKTILLEREQINKDAIEYNKRLEETEREGAKLQLRLQKAKDKIPPLVGPELNGTLGEFEAVSAVRLEGGEPVAIIVDQIEDYKEAIRKNKKESAKK